MQILPAAVDAAAVSAAAGGALGQVRPESRPYADEAAAEETTSWQTGTWAKERRCDH